MRPASSPFRLIRRTLPSFVVLALLFPSAVPPPFDAPRLEAEKNVGLAALEEGKGDEARRRFEEVRRLAPGEPLGWANGAVAAMRAKDRASAETLLAQARRLAPQDARVLALDGVRRELAGDPRGAVEAFEQAFARDPKNIASAWAAARLLKEGVPGAGRRAVQRLQTALEQAPANLFLLTRLAQWLREEGDAARAVAALEALAAAAGGPDAKLDRYLGEADTALRAGDAQAASLKLRIIENLLRNDPRYQQARRDVDPGVVGIPLEAWTPALAARVRARTGSALDVSFVLVARDTGLTDLRGLSAVWAGGRDGRDLVWAGAGGITVTANRGGRFARSATLDGPAAALKLADIDNSGTLDVVTPGAFWLGSRRNPLPPGDAVLPLDFDSDGDLDLYLSARLDRILRNNGDGTWRELGAEAGLPAGLSSVAAVSEDFDRDGDPDVLAALREGGLVLLDNLRGGRLALRQAASLLEAEAGGWPRVAAGDLDGDGRADLVIASDEKAAVVKNRGDGTFLPPRGVASAGSPVLFDLDNDGDLDVVFLARAGSRLWRNDGSGGFAPADPPLPGARDGRPIDYDADGDLDLALVLADGRAAIAENRGGNAHGWMNVVLEGLATGSGKVNRLGYGSDIEVKAQDLYVYRSVQGPVTHVGLGPRRRAEVLRVVWTNGIPQNSLNPETRATVREVQQLKGSCPFVYAHDGRRWHFISDALGASPLGLLYDGVRQAPANTREWLIVSGDHLRARQGVLTLDFTEELWETAYLDLARLYAVDHPGAVEMVSNDRMSPPPFPRKMIHGISRPQSPRATDESGRDRTPEIRAIDGDFAGGFTPTRYQGIVRPHSLTLELPAARRAGAVMLYLTGWIFYSDTSIQVALSQGAGEKPFGPVLEVPDGRGGWKVALSAMGYPAGKTKTIALDLSSMLDRADPRVRIRTNLEIYWDRIVYTVGDPPPGHRLTEVPLKGARLFFRGFSRMVREFPEGPHVFRHDEVDPGPRWPDMRGRYTRLGDVRDLVARVDDRYVVMKSGDAVRLEFSARGLLPPPPGWTRDWLLELDGWDKDADENTIAGETVEPLPFHGQDDSRYGEPQQFPDAAAQRKFREETLTRPGGPEAFRDDLRRRAARAGAR